MYVLKEVNLNLCNEPNFIELLDFIRKVIGILKVVAALVLIIMGMVTLTKSIIDNKYELDKALKNLGTKMMLACIVWLIPTIINWIFFTDNFVTRNNKTLHTCVENLSGEVSK